MNNDNYENEEFLIKEISNGCEVAYAYLFKKFHGDLCNYLLAISGDSLVAEEISQQAFVKLWEKRKSLSIQDNALKPYFFRIAYNLFIDYKRKEKKKNQLIEHLKQDAYLDIINTESSQFEQRLKLLNTEIENLPNQCRTVFILGKKEGLKYHEISDILNISIKTVEAHMSKALKKLRTQISIFFF